MDPADWAFALEQSLELERETSERRR